MVFLWMKIDEKKRPSSDNLFGKNVWSYDLVYIRFG